VLGCSEDRDGVQLRWCVNVQSTGMVCCSVGVSMFRGQGCCAAQLMCECSEDRDGVLLSWCVNVQRRGMVSHLLMVRTEYVDLYVHSTLYS